MREQRLPQQSRSFSRTSRNKNGGEKRDSVSSGLPPSAASAGDDPMTFALAAQGPAMFLFRALHHRSLRHNPSRVTTV